MPTPTPTAETTVRSWFDAYAALDADRLVALHIPERREIQRAGYESFVPAPGEAFEDLEFEVLSESENESVIEARANRVWGHGPTPTPVRWKFRLSKQDGEWLIHGLSGFVPKGLLVWVEVVVTDVQGNLIPGAKVSISAGDGQQETQLTDNSGLAVFPDATRGGGLSITVEKKGFTYYGSDVGLGSYTLQIGPE
jgi:hypothetical protein